MNYRQREYEALGLDARWLEHERASNAYAFALKYSHPRRYGLNEGTVANIELHVIGSNTVAENWLKERLSAEGTVQVVYGDAEVCVLSAASFLRSWQSIFVPGRDDAVILHNVVDTVVFYCHEGELELGRRVG